MFNYPVALETVKLKEQRRDETRNKGDICFTIFSPNNIVCFVNFPFSSLLIGFIRMETSTVMSEMRREPRLAAGCHQWGHLSEAQTATEYDGWGSPCVCLCVWVLGGGHRGVEGPSGLALQSNEPFQKGRGETPSTSALTHTYGKKEKGPDMMTACPRGGRGRVICWAMSQF